eukprot:scaffold29618_cov183-Amphora_coffeaeformis.AAC.3
MRSHGQQVGCWRQEGQLRIPFLFARPSKRPKAMSIPPKGLPESRVASHNADTSGSFPLSSSLWRTGTRNDKASRQLGFLVKERFASSPVKQSVHAGYSESYKASSMTTCQEELFRIRTMV